jgi:16S rRNA C967 or C1407 C5-methylase (RsmB/RsmF family)
MARERGLKSGELARVLDAMHLATMADSFEALRPKYKALERRLLALENSDFMRREVRRRIAERLFTAAFARNCPWPVFGRALRRLQQLGYTDVERRYHVAALYAQWSRTHPERDSREAHELLEEAERRIRRLPRTHRYREELLERLEDLRARTGFGALPEEASARPRAKPSRR